MGILVAEGGVTVGVTGSPGHGEGRTMGDTEITVDRSCEDVWGYFTRIEHWAAWSAPLCAAVPGWETGGSLAWADGATSTLDTVVPAREVALTTGILRSRYLFTPLEGDRTLVRHRVVSASAAGTSAGGDGAHAGHTPCLATFKHLVEQAGNVADAVPRAAMRMPIEDVVAVPKVGTVVRGQIEQGAVKVSDQVDLIDLQGRVTATTVTHIELARTSVDEARAPDRVGIAIQGVHADEIEQGMVLARPDPHTPTAWQGPGEQQPRDVRAPKPATSPQPTTLSWDVCPICRNHDAPVVVRAGTPKAHAVKAAFYGLLFVAALVAASALTLQMLAAGQLNWDPVWVLAAGAAVAWQAARHIRLRREGNVTVACARGHTWGIATTPAQRTAILDEAEGLLGADRVRR